MDGIKQRDIWVDNVKVIACILVVLGHFFQSMAKAEIVSENNIYLWFEQTIYFFHVPLFFICSGYLYQELSNVNDIYSWSKNILKKALNLGVPYFTFSIITWLLKTIFESSVNDELDSLYDTLFLHPVSPYWYLYSLFLIFLITPTFKNKTAAVIGLILAFIFKIIGLTAKEFEIQAIYYTLTNEIWFVIGMCLSIIGIRKTTEKIKSVVPIIMGIAFIIMSILEYKLNIQYSFTYFLLGLAACSSVILLMIKIYSGGNQNILFGILTKYTMQIFLMHTLFAAPLRVLLIKFGIHNTVIHVISGIAVSFAGPVLAAYIFEKSKWLEFFVFPGRYIKITNKNRECNAENKQDIDMS